MANERGTKRTDPDTGKKFYDLNMDPIVSPYTGKSYPRSFFEALPGKPSPATARKIDDEDDNEEEDEVEETAGPEIVSLEEADAEENGDDIPDVEDVEVDEDLGDDDEDTFLEEDEDEDDSLGFDVGDDEDR
ncbi:TIGR02300 family protein [uncultured Devosia sp.]|uniref:TIGR02300 family protein n=1 Tax=uncultured Devosia sp. TaxID=211434 RepID=UPI002612F5C0|nr:TIGR02300 family protein [uncultured Devosia sp.]